MLFGEAMALDSGQIEYITGEEIDSLLGRTVAERVVGNAVLSYKEPLNVGYNPADDKLNSHTLLQTASMDRATRKRIFSIGAGEVLKRDKRVELRSFSENDVFPEQSKTTYSSLRDEINSGLVDEEAILG